MNLRSLWFKIKGLKCKLFGHSPFYEFHDEHIIERLYRTKTGLSPYSVILCMCCRNIIERVVVESTFAPEGWKFKDKSVDFKTAINYIEDIYRATPEDLTLAKMLNEDHYKILKTLNPNVKELEEK